MKTVLILNDRYPACSKWLTANKRIESFSRYLPESDWRPIFVTRACQCIAHYKVENEFLFLQPNESISSMSKRIRTYLHDGGQTIVISCDYNRTYKLYSLLNFLTHEPASAPHNLLYSLYFSSTTKTLLTPFLPIVVMLRKLMSALRPLDESDFTNRLLSLSDSIFETLPIDVVIGSYPSFVQLDAARALSKKHSVPSIADMRDCLLRSIHAHQQRHRRWKISHYRRVIQSAATMVHVTAEESARDKQDIDIPAVVIENGYFHDEIARALKEPIANDVFTIRFIGTIYPMQDWAKVIQNIDYFLEKYSLNHEDFRLEFYGNVFNECPAILSSPLVHCMGTVDRSTALRLCAGADALLHLTFITPNTTNPYHGVPGAKLYEYLALNRPLIAIGPPDSYVDALLKQSDNAWRCETNTDMANTLYTIYKKRQQSQTMSTEVSTCHTQFDRKNTVARYAKLLNQLTDRN